MSGGLSVSPGLVALDNFATIGGTQIAPSATTLTKGAWVSIGTPKYNASSFLLRLGYENQGKTDFKCSWDIGIGASGSQVVLIPDMVQSVDKSGVFSYNLLQMWIPLALTAGVPIWARTAVNVASNTSLLRAWLTTYDGHALSPGGYAGVETLGNTSVGGGTVVTGGAGVKGSYVLVGTTTRNWQGFFVTFDLAGNSSNESGDLIDIAIGSSQKIILPDLFMYQGGVETFCHWDYTAIPIPAGTPIYVRASNVAPATTFGVSIHGVY